MSHISTKMRRYETASRIFLILSVVSFALAAPVSVQGIQEMHVDIVDLTEGGRGASQKRMYSWDEGPTNWADGKSEPPGASSPDIMEHWFHPSPPPPHAITELAPGSSSAPAAPLLWGAQQPHPGDLSESDLWKQWLLDKPNSPSLPEPEANPPPPALPESTSPGTPAPPESTPPWTPAPPESTPPWTPESTPPETPALPKGTPPETPAPPGSTPPETPAPPSGPPPKTPGPSSPNPELQHPTVYQSESETESESFLDKLLKGKIR